MADKENQACPRSRASRKRPSESGLGNQVVKKRAVLGELTNISSDASDLGQSSNLEKDRKFTPEPASKKVVGPGVNFELVVSPGSDAPRKSECTPSIYQHLHSMEVEAKRRPSPYYMEKVQMDITPSMRAILVDWLVEVAEEYKLFSDTLHLTVSYIDRYLSAHNLSRNKLQLLGVSCMLVASKYEEITPPHIEDFCYITDNTYTKQEILEMEKEINKFLDFEIGIPTIKSFIRIFTNAVQENKVLSNLKFDLLCCYLAELSLLDYDCLRFIPSTVAASAIFLARMTILPKRHPWTLALQRQTGYRPYELKECVLRLHYLQLKTERYPRAVWQKYMDHKFKCVASLEPPARIPSCYFEISNE